MSGTPGVAGMSEGRGPDDPAAGADARAAGDRGPAGAEALDWLRLIRSDNVGAATFWSLLERFGSAGEALAALPGLAARGGARRPLTPAGAGVAERELAAAERRGIRHVFLGSRGYPPMLAAIAAPPPILMVRGSVDALHRRPLAIVGARKASASGRMLAASFAEAFGDAGHTVVSGLALGIDAAAHKASLASGTAAAVAGGVDVPTPPENGDLADAIAGAGALISEMPLGHRPVARDYPRRNRLIAGLSEAVLIVEAAHRSGSLYTARYAADGGREVFVVPGSPADPRVAGSLDLLREGATIAVAPSDVLQTLDVAHGFAEPAEAFTTRVTHEPCDVEAVHDALSLAPIDINDLARALDAPVQRVLGAVLELELAGRIEREPDGTVRRTL